MNEDTAMSYDEWAASGYHVIKGQKSQLRDIEGVPQFTKDQVEANQSRHPARRHVSHWERSASRAQAKGTPWSVVEDFDSFVREAGMLPDLSRRTRFNITDPLEMHFMNVADKHGILDRILDGEDDY